MGDPHVFGRESWDTEDARQVGGREEEEATLRVEDGRVDGVP